MNAVWTIKSLDSDDLRHAESLAQDLGVSIGMAKLLVQRGIRGFEEAREFFRPHVKYIHDPFLMKDMDVAVERLNKALRKREKILVYGDYDVDGTTAVSIVYSFLKTYVKDIRYYIPDRYKEGYGISYQSIEYARENDFSLVIALDCGIKANAQIQKAKEYGIDFIICDHHTPGEELPDAVAVLNPHREDCEYPYKDLSGCGVGFKLVQAFCISNNIPEERAFAYMDLVAVSIASDIVPIAGENRVLAALGLNKLNREPSKGLKSIIDVCGLADRQIDISDIVFKIGPRINASGRLYSGSEAVQLLTASREEVLDRKTTDIDNYNTERKGIDKDTTEEAKQQFLAVPNYKDKKAIVLYNPNWNRGIVGIVASRIAEEFCRPTIILTDNDDGLISGSGRSVEGFDLYAAIDHCADLMTNFGGHPYAAGLTLEKSRLKEFRHRFEAFVEQTILPEQLVPQIEIDTEIDFRIITPKFLRILKQFAPFGPENMKPLFYTKNLKDYNNLSRLIGKDSTHAKLYLTQDGRQSFDCVAFCSGYMRNYDMSQFIRHLKGGGEVEVCYTIEENSFNNITSTQLMVRDMHII